MKRAARVLLAAPAISASVALAIAGCEAIADLTGPHELAPDAGAPSTSTSGSGGGSCTHATFPAPPPISNAGGAIDFVVALRSMDMGDDQAPDAGTIGLDLDKTCTCEGEGPSCADPSWIPKGTKLCDGIAGRDDDAARAFSLISFAVGSGNFGSSFFSERADAGDWSLLVRVRGYDGGQDDDQVEVSVYPTTGFAGTGLTASWMGDDLWPIPSSALGVDANGDPDLDQPIATDPHAWVTGGTVVASLEAADILLGAKTSRVRLTLTAGVLLGKIVKVGARYRIDDGVVAARWKMSDVFGAVSSFRDDMGAPFCTDTIYYQAAKKDLCSLVDIASTLASPTDPCDALSLGMAFTTAPSKLGAIVPPPDPPDNACPSETDPINDACDAP